jgi:hypothetical protein
MVRPLVQCKLDKFGNAIVACLSANNHVCPVNSDLHCSKKARATLPSQQPSRVTLPGASSEKDNKCSNQESLDLPVGVVNVFPANNDQSTCYCATQPQRTTRASCDVAQIFFSQYGADNLAYLQEREKREYPFKASTYRTDTCLPTPSTTNERITDSVTAYWAPRHYGTAEGKFLENWCDHLPKQPWVTTRMRAILVSWLVEVTVQLETSDQAFHVAITILDRVLSSGVTKEQYKVDPQHDQDANFFCLKINELQALGWYVLCFGGLSLCSCHHCILCSLCCGSLLSVLVYG